MNDSVIAAGTASVLVSVLLGLVAYVWTALALQAVFRKTGEQGWKAWVPILNGVTLLQLGGFSGWWMLLLIIPPAAVVLYVLMIVACHRLNVGFGYGAGMTVLAALLFPVWASVVGWSSNRWVGASPGSGHRVGPVRTGAPAPAQAMDAPRPQALAWHTGAPAASAAAARTTTAGDRMSPATGPVPAASGPLSYVPAGSAPSGAAPMTSLADREPLLDTPAYGDVPEESDGFDDLRARHHAPFTGTTPVVTPADDVPAAPRPAVATEEPAPAVDRRASPAGDDVPADPVSAAAAPPAPATDPWAPPPATRAPFGSEPYGFSDTSGEVSAVAGAPVLGAPMAARSSVSALRGQPELPDAESAFDETILAARRRTAWMLVPPLGAPIAITQDVLILGRRPSFDPAFPAAQLVPIADETRTMSKTHARLELRDGTWVITDLDSTNGVVLIDLDGTEIEVAPGRPMPIVERFLLGDAELALARDNT
ncbi:FHA domain-containing protein [Microbacterium sp. SYP-A9085]|uniref:DUF5684 domain-containing protein n=1 Tax=Microbacterium sp. SYP-A9085 TaxID=2664454 RepID=UPI00129A94AB|nr:DUF5684 domain-containing protein [Microbacterium sp. SYP-A9085]MRH29959.1 FHA domain-containing protein [Microbacterium sp. SYP-A9085]